MLLLVFAILALLSLSHALIEPALQWSTPVFEFRGWFWIPAIGLAWLLAGGRS